MTKKEKIAGERKRERAFDRRATLLASLHASRLYNTFAQKADALTRIQSRTTSYIQASMAVSYITSSAGRCVLSSRPSQPPRRRRRRDKRSRPKSVSLTHVHTSRAGVQDARPRQKNRRNTDRERERERCKGGKEKEMRDRSEEERDPSPVRRSFRTHTHTGRPLSPASTQFRC